MSLPNHLLIIDAQNDFCDLPEAWWPRHPIDGQAIAPALPVAGAHQDMLRLAELIDRAQGRIEAITTTLDSHHRLDIAHPGFWQRADGSTVAPFTPITGAAIDAGEFKTRLPEHQARARRYVSELEARGRYTLMVWPVHCEIGSWGHGLHAAVASAVGRWELARQRASQAVFKGDNPWTEHYSVLQAEVPDPADEGTALNLGLIRELDQADTIMVAGEASSHCVRASVEHLVEHLPSGRADKVVLLTDCMSPVTGFEAAASEFLASMQQRGVQLATSRTVLA